MNINQDSEGHIENNDNTTGPLLNKDRRDSLNETDAIPHPLTKFSEMNNSIQVLKPADIVMGEHQMLEDTLGDGTDKKDAEYALDGLMNEARNEITSVMSSLNQSLLNQQPSNAVSQSFVDLDQEEEDEFSSYDNAYREGALPETVQTVKESIVDLYLAIKIRSTEELDKIDEEHLKQEKQKLLKQCHSFQILEYIRSSIEIIMNLQIEDLEKNDQKKAGEKNDDQPASTMRKGQDTEVSLTGISVASHNLILQSMKDALIHMIENKETADNVDSSVMPDSSEKDGGSSIKQKRSRVRRGPPAVYEKIIQKLESDIRGHIRLEHEMKIHMDYLEGKVEKLQKDFDCLALDKEKMDLKVEELKRKLKEITDDRDLKQAQLQQKKNLNEKLTQQMDDMRKEHEQQLSLKIGQSFTLPPSTNHQDGIPTFLANQPNTTLSTVALPQNHLAIKNKYNSIDVGYEDHSTNPQQHGADFDENFPEKKTRTNTNINTSQKRMMPSGMHKQGDIMRASVQSMNQNIYHQAVNTKGKTPGRQKMNNYVKSVGPHHNQDSSSHSSHQNPKLVQKQSQSSILKQGKQIALRGANGSTSIQPGANNYAATDATQSSLLTSDHSNSQQQVKKAQMHYKGVKSKSQMDDINAVPDGYKIKGVGAQNSMIDNYAFKNNIPAQPGAHQIELQNQNRLQGQVVSNGQFIVYQEPQQPGQPRGPQQHLQQPDPNYGSHAVTHIQGNNPYLLEINKNNAIYQSKQNKALQKQHSNSNLSSNILSGMMNMPMGQKLFNQKTQLAPPGGMLLSQYGGGNSGSKQFPDEPAGGKFVQHNQRYNKKKSESFDYNSRILSGHQVGTNQSSQNSTKVVAGTKKRQSVTDSFIGHHPLNQQQINQQQQLQQLQQQQYSLQQQQQYVQQLQQKQRGMIAPTTSQKSILFAQHNTKSQNYVSGPPTMLKQSQSNEKPQSNQILSHSTQQPQVKLSVRNNHNKSIGAIPDAQLDLLKQSSFATSSIDRRQPAKMTGNFHGKSDHLEKHVMDAARKHKQNSSSADLLQRNINIDGGRPSIGGNMNNSGKPQTMEKGGNHHYTLNTNTGHGDSSSQFEQINANNNVSKKKQSARRGLSLNGTNKTNSKSQINNPPNSHQMQNRKDEHQPMHDLQQQHKHTQMIDQQNNSKKSSRGASSGAQQQHATLVVRNQINIINNNQSQQIFSKDQVMGDFQDFPLPTNNQMSHMNLHTVGEHNQTMETEEPQDGRMAGIRQQQQRSNMQNHQNNISSNNAHLINSQGNRRQNGNQQVRERNQIAGMYQPGHHQSNQKTKQQTQQMQNQSVMQMFGGKNKDPNKLTVHLSQSSASMQQLLTQKQVAAQEQQMMFGTDMTGVQNPASHQSNGNLQSIQKTTGQISLGSIQMLPANSQMHQSQSQFPSSEQVIAGPIPSGSSNQPHAAGHNRQSSSMVLKGRLTNSYVHIPKQQMQDGNSNMLGAHVNPNSKYPSMQSTGQLSQGSGNTGKGNKNVLLKNSSSTHQIHQQQQALRYSNANMNPGALKSNAGNAAQGYHSSGQRKTSNKMSISQQKSGLQGSLLTKNNNTVGQASNNSIVTMGSLDNFQVRGAVQVQPTNVGGHQNVKHRERSTSQNSRGAGGTQNEEHSRYRQHSSANQTKVGAMKGQKHSKKQSRFAGQQQYF